ncbi:IS481 family transposase [Caulobacter sp. Root655]|uniref:IS481 family transposase n=1 Tax=Caulobacter sp. Root655 TaxID=1736578 RepID=UPI001910D761|nr:IS481 family transposase [Caulobacter sp. Root655]
MDERIRFMGDWLGGEVSRTELCELYGISRKTGYKWAERYEAAGIAGLAERSRAPLDHGRATAADLVEKIVDLRRARPTWGPRKIMAKLGMLHPDLAWPSHSTAHEILKRAGLVSGRRLRRRPPPYPGVLTAAQEPNHVWAVDHKGWIVLGDGGRCEPLTLADTYSRFLLAASAGSSIRADQAKPVMERAFRTYGLPRVIRSDNGQPFASTGATGLTRLSVWWIKLGIHPERITPGRPQQNGRLERLHRTLLEAMRPAARTRTAQARRLDAFRHDYNHERPHQALGQTPPANFYAPSPRQMPSRLADPDYPAGMITRRVRPNGEIRLRGASVHISSALAGEGVGVEQTEQGWCVWFYQEPIGLLDHRGQKLSPIQPG